MAFKGWDKVKIKTDQGNIVDAITPTIVSASRSTDIPAFHPEWFINRLNKGYVVWENPFNKNQRQYVSFEKTRVIVFWTKNAEPIIPFLKKINEKKINYYFQFTLNDYENEGFEPHVPKLENRIKTFKKLSDMIGKEKVIWRFDPLILTDKLGVEQLIDKIYNIGETIHKYTKKLVISFADIEPYAKVKRNMKKADIEYRNFDRTTMERFAKELQKINKVWGLELATCAESIDFNKYDIKHNKCIDDDLMIKLFDNDKVLMDFLGMKKENEPKKVDLSSFGGGFEPVSIENKLKDKGQRKECSCIVSKDIGQYNTCMHLCVYCYANFSEKVVRKNLKRITINSESILGY